MGGASDGRLGKSVPSACTPPVEAPITIGQSSVLRQTDEPTRTALCSVSDRIKNRRPLLRISKAARTLAQTRANPPHRTPPRGFATTSAAPASRALIVRRTAPAVRPDTTTVGQGLLVM